jgi:hypothetical protein
MASKPQEVNCFEHGCDHGTKMQTQRGTEANGFSFYMSFQDALCKGNSQRIQFFLQSTLHRGKVTGYNQMQFSSSSSQCKKLALQPRVHKEQALHLRWEQLEPGVFDALSLQEMVKDCVSKWLQVAMTVAAIAYPPYARVTKVSCTNCTDHSTQAGSKLAELRAGKCIWIHTKTISAAYPHVCWVFPTCLITSFVIGWQS